MTDDIVEKIVMKGKAAEEIRRLRAENEKLHREAAIRIDQITREQDSHLRTITDYNRAMVEKNNLKTAFRVNMLRAFPHMSHDEIDAEIAAAIRETRDD